MIFAVLPAILALQEPVLLTYKPDATNVMVMQSAAPLKVSKPVPKELGKPTFFTIRFAGATRTIAIGKSGGQTRVVIDQDGDGALRDETPITLRKSDPFFAGTGPFPMRWTIDGKPTMGHYRAQVYSSRGNKSQPVDQVLLGAVGAWTGELTLNDLKVPVRIVDVRAEGRYSDPDCVSFGDPGTMFMNYRGVGHDGIYQTVVPSPTGDSIRVTPREFPSKAVAFKGDKAKVTVEVGGESYYVEGHEGVVTLPEDARISTVSIVRKDRQGRTWTLSAREPYVYTASGVRQGSPIKTEDSMTLEPIVPIAAGQKQGTQWVFTLGMKTANGLEVTGIDVNGQTPPAPKLKIQRNGRTVDTQQFHYG